MQSSAVFHWRRRTAGLPGRCRDMAAVASASKSVAIIHEPSYYVRELPIEVASSSDYLFNTNQIALRTLYGVDGNIPDLNAVKVLVSANT